MVVAVVDFGMGNHQSVVNALRHLGEDTTITDEHAALAEAKALILPGVGAFGDAMANLHARGLVPVLNREIREKRKPCLGICLGMELLLSRSHEHGVHDGLDWIEGEVRRISASEGAAIRVPHVGWNTVRFRFEHPLTEGLSEDEDFYFVHSYRCVPQKSSVILGACTYGGDLASILVKDNIAGVQFHPEKSHLPGLALLNNWCRHFVHRQD